MKKSLVGILALLVLTGCLATSTPVVSTGTNGLPVTNFVYTPSGWVGQVQAGVQTAAPLIPPPYNLILTAVAGLFGTGVAAYVAFKNKQGANTWQGVATSVIEGVESAGPAADAVKKAIAATSLAKGNADHVEAAVQKIV